MNGQNYKVNLEGHINIFQNKVWAQLARTQIKIFFNVWIQLE